MPRNLIEDARRIYILITCHNRSATTEQAIRLASRSCDAAGITAQFIVYDDGSTDDTPSVLESLRQELDLVVIRGDGTAFWAAGMRSAEARALHDAQDTDLVLWLNDDVVLFPEAVSEALLSHEIHPHAVLVGATRDPGNDALSYSGLTRSGFHPLAFSMARPTGDLVPVDSFNGNFVLISGRTARRVGGIDGRFTHAFADIDYGIRAKSAGVQVLLLPDAVGTCARNPPLSPLPIRAAWRRHLGVKGGGNFDSLRRILKKSNRSSWLIFIVASYVKWWLTETSSRAGSSKQSVLPRQD